MCVCVFLERHHIHAVANGRDDEDVRQREERGQRVVRHREVLHGTLEVDRGQLGVDARNHRVPVVSTERHAIRVSFQDSCVYLSSLQFPVSDSIWPRWIVPTCSTAVYVWLSGEDSRSYTP